MFKDLLIKILYLVLPEIMDAIIMSLARLAKRSDNTIDDMIVGAFMAHKDKIVDDMKANK
jgi:hypothetical protein